MIVIVFYLKEPYPLGCPDKIAGTTMAADIIAADLIAWDKIAARTK